MTNQKSSSIMTVLVALFGLTIAFQFSQVPLLFAEDEMSEELRSTIASDPENRSKKSSTSSAPSKKVASSTSSSGGDNIEDKEWKTMRSETHRRRRRSRGVSSIRIDLTKNRVFTPKIGFASNSDQPTPRSIRILKRLAEKLGQRSDLAVRIEGHTDSIGYDQQNLDLSQRRANSVQNILIENGVPGNRLQAVGMGDRNLLASSTTTAGQEKNRRVEFHISAIAAAPAVPTATTPVPQPMVPVSALAPTAATPASQSTAPAATTQQPATSPTPQATLAPTTPAVPSAPAPTTQPSSSSIPAASAPTPAPGLVAPPQATTPPAAPFATPPQ